MIRAFFFYGLPRCAWGKESGNVRFPDGWIARNAPSLAFVPALHALR